MARMMVCSCDGSAMVAIGRAEANSMAAKASSISTGGTWRRQPGPLPMASRTMERLA